MTTTSGPAGGTSGGVALTGKLLDEGSPDRAAFSFLVMPGAIKVDVPSALEQSGSWKNKPLGHKCTIRVPADFAHRHNLVFGQVGGLGGSMGTKGSGFGGVLHG